MGLIYQAGYDLKLFVNSLYKFLHTQAKNGIPENPVNL